MRIGQRPSIATQSVRRNEASRCANSGRKQVQQTVALFDHHVGELLNAQWHLYAKSLGGLQVDYKLEFYRDWEFACLRASEDTISIDCRLPKIVERIIPVGDQATDFRHFGPPDFRNGSFTSFLPSRVCPVRPKSGHSAVGSVYEDTRLPIAGKQLLPAARLPARGAAPCLGRWRQRAGRWSCCP